MQGLKGQTIDELSLRHRFSTKDLAFDEGGENEASYASSTSKSVKAEPEAGSQLSEHYRSKLSPFRFKLRGLCLPLIRKEADVLYSIQSKFRHPVLDFYFAWTANLASHTFYVLMLPLPIWYGAGILSRDLIYVLGLGIYLTGNLKDYLCLPRPSSPPLHRITMSSYTTQEYGFPSSHSANATAVTLILLWKVFQFQNQLTLWQIVGIVSFLILYYVSLIVGRIYCGMHGFVDIGTGSVVGVIVFLFRFIYGARWDHWLLESHNDSTLGLIGTPVLVFAGYILLIHLHSEPVDDCPCFDDSVAFIGVLIGIDLSHWMAHVTQAFTELNAFNDPVLIVFDYEKLGIIKAVSRAVVGIVLVAVWKLLSKPFIFTILPPIYKFVGINLPRRYYRATASTSQSNRNIRSQSISNLGDDRIADITNLIHGVTDHDKRDDVGPTNDIDYYELVDNPRSNFDHSEPINIAGVFKPRYDVEIIGRVFVYAGVATTAVWGFYAASLLLNIL